MPRPDLRRIKIIAIIATAIALIYMVFFAPPPKYRGDAEECLRSAKEIVIHEEWFEWGKQYYVLVDGKTVGTVKGDNVHLFGDTFTLKTVDGKMLASEKEHKRWLGLNRAASCYGPDGNITGYIGEEKISDIFSISYVFHIYDADKNEVGCSKKLGKTSFNRHKLYDNQDSIDYDIDKQFIFSIADYYVITVKDHESSIPLEHAILMVCIEDAIGDSN